MKKIITSAVTSLLVTMLSVFPIFAEETVDASVTVEAVCTLDVSPTSIAFNDGLGGPVLPGETSDSELVTLTNTGNTDIDSLLVSGDDWDVGGFPPTMPVGSTAYDDGSGFDDLELLASAEPVFGSFLADDAIDTVDFSVTVPVDQPADSYSQTITFTFGCDGG